MAWGLSSALNVSTASMLARQKQMSVTSSNVANIDNPYYHRRTAVVESLDIAGNNSYGGTGVYLATVTRQYDAELEKSLQAAISDDSYRQELLSRISELENVIGANGENQLTLAMAKFAGSLQTLAASPESISARSSLLANGDALATEFNQEYKNMATLRDAIAGNDAAGKGYISSQLTEVNSLLNQISSLNVSINRVEDNDYRNQPALDLRDERDKLVKQLAAYADVTVTEDQDTGQYTVEINLDGGGKVKMIDGAVVPQGAADQLQMSMVENPVGFFTPQIVTSSAPAVPLTLNTDTGSLRGLLDAREYITSQMSDMYNFAAAFATELNQLQMGGYDLDGTLSTGKFFSVPAAQPAKGSIIALDSYVKGNPRRVAAADQANQQGNGNNAIAMWNKINEDDLYQNESLMSYTDHILSAVALQVSEAQSTATTAANVLQMFTSAVAERSAVTMDVEMVNMLELQRAYQAAAKMISTIDRMFETVINMA